jgi:hypothetical protein
MRGSAAGYLFTEEGEMEETRIELTAAQFMACEQRLVTCGSLAATTFRFRSGVCAVRLTNEWGAVTVLPFQGQQVWSAEFGAEHAPRRTLTMRSMFEQPYPTREFLATFGGFLQHCGATGMGVPSAQDSHALHGELPNAPYQHAYLVTGVDTAGPYIGVGGVYQHTVAFSHNYMAEPLLKLRAGATTFTVRMQITNLKQSPMALMYLAHVNFRPVDNGRLVYSVPRTAEHVRARTSLPTHIQVDAAFVEFINQLRNDPFLHETLTPGTPFDPEAVFFLDYVADEAGWAHTLQLHPDGSADYLRHRPDQLPRATRWICRTADQDALAMVEPGTAETEGYSAEKAKGFIRLLASGERFDCELEIGLLPPAEAAQLAARVEAMRDAS